ncbi:sugar phosphate isomerase/epimerase family protein [Mahella australiensis]|uniref:Xylose isomerase domain-containing protein TIM barrel n=1 Tax=Mahella australiensis (strain DSM 15567 / CIP 107919 / 50-1 BON) TaxID=697281 RepID=F3ZVN6_MAHA5|nr:sugar phosphate isomerase/epimerase [Mahella australiensis]AEE97430.1 Xylose isomerase domain-containing protein TIM barrel [Mahella australiensis 50-1 BON]
MKIGFITNSLSGQGLKNLDEIADWGIENGFADLEIGPSISLEEEVFSRIKEARKINISALIYCRNFLDEDERVAQEHQMNLKKRIEFAGRLGIQKVICSTGVTKEAFQGIRYEPEKSVEAVVELLKTFIELAEKNNVRLCIENCPMMGNIALSPDIWKALFDKLDSDKVGLAYDPSHMVWQMMNPYEPIKEFGHKVFHVHGKDTEIMYNSLNRAEILSNQQWWRYGLPGLGDIQWGRIIANLDEIGYDGTISIEHEDPVWEGSFDKVKKGILKAKKHIEQFID